MTADRLCAVCDHSEHVHRVLTSDHRFTPKVNNMTARPVTLP